jgi:hypothetical protein
MIIFESFATLVEARIYFLRQLGQSHKFDINKNKFNQFNLALILDL